MGRVAFAVVSSICFLLVAGLEQVCPLERWEAEAIPTHDLASEPLYLDNRWEGGMLRVRLSGTGTLPGDWRIHLSYGSDVEMDFDVKSGAGRMVGRGETGQVTLDVPIVADRTLTARVTPTGLGLQIIAVLYPSRVNSQQMIGQGKIDLFDPEVGLKERALGPGFGRVDLLASNNQMIGTCTGFRVAPGYWLTAAHCVARDPEDPERPDIKTIRIQPIDYADRPEGAALLKAVPVAGGQVGGQADSARELRVDDLDYAVLEVQNDPGGPIFRMAGEVVVAPSEELQLFQHWPGRFAPAAGKARCADRTCVVYERIGANDPSRPQLCPNAIQHGCSSQRGASGGPLVLRSSPLQVIGLHYRGGLVNVFNCGLPTATIVKHLCATKRSIAERITSCD